MKSINPSTGREWLGGRVRLGIRTTQNPHSQEPLKRSTQQVCFGEKAAVCRSGLRLRANSLTQRVSIRFVYFIKWCTYFQNKIM